LAQTGLVDKWIRDLAPNQRACGDQMNPKKTRIGLGNLKSSFTILLVGLAISFVIFVIEILTSARRRNRLVSMPFNKQEIKKIDKQPIKKLNKQPIKKFNKQQTKK
jgi:heme/copper-type cytochrome/quinol oxidase subunit 1